MGALEASRLGIYINGIHRERFWEALAEKTPEDYYNEWAAQLESTGTDENLSSKDYFVAGFNIGSRKP